MPVLSSCCENTDLVSLNYFDSWSRAVILIGGGKWKWGGFRAGSSSGVKLALLAVPFSCTMRPKLLKLLLRRLVGEKTLKYERLLYEVQFELKLYLCIPIGKSCSLFLRMWVFKHFKSLKIFLCPKEANFHALLLTMGVVQ